MATQKSYVNNTGKASQLNLKGNTAKTTPKSNAAKKSGSGRSTKQAATKKTTSNRRKTYQRNAASVSSLAGSAAAAFGGALIINAFDLALNRVLPATTSNLWRIGLKFGAAYLLTTKTVQGIPGVKRIAPLATSALMMAGALDFVSSIIMPKVLEAISNASLSGLPLIGGLFGNSATPAAQIAATTDGAQQLGANLVQMPDGSLYRVQPNYAAQQNRVGYDPKLYQPNIWSNYNRQIAGAWN